MPGTSHADVNRTPIAIPLIGTEVSASPYPSSITLDPKEGPAQTGQISITLHAVTHPCPQELAVVLVHGPDKWLLMNNAGGCRPLEGTTIEFVNNSNLPAILETPQTLGQPFGEFIRVQPSFNGPQPTPPAPYPAGGVLVSGMPTEIEDLAGKWDLYVIDKGGSGRGVIAGGWSLNYDTAIRRQHIGIVALPKAPFTEGAAQVYPITFDMSTVRPDVRAANVSVLVDFAHQEARRPRDGAAVAGGLVGGRDGERGRERRDQRRQDDVRRCGESAAGERWTAGVRHVPADRVAGHVSGEGGRTGAAAAVSAVVQRVHQRKP